MIENLIKRKVDELIYEWGTREPIRLCKYLGIRVKYGDYGSIKGAFRVILDKKCIFINDNLEENEKKIILSHELGHAILHSNESIQELLMFEHMVKSGKLENEANLFAIYLLKEEYSHENIKIALERLSNWSY